MPKSGLDYLRAQRDVLYQQTLFDILLKQFEAAKLDEAKDSSVIQVLEPAIEPDQRTSPKRFVILSSLLLIGLFLGCLTALVLHKLEKELASPEGSVAVSRLKQALFCKDRER
jgi:uncharacterized protein involved in exopolysaccharide biosynthesis